MRYKLIRSSRRSLALVVDSQARLVIRAPKFISTAEIEHFIATKQRWIGKHQQLALKRMAGQKKYQDGERFLFLGQEYPLRVVEQPRRPLVFEQGQFLLPRSGTGAAQALFIKWYRQQARHLLPKRAAYWAQKMQVSYQKLTITGAQSRWGSCSAKGGISFSWRLVTAPLATVDYVVMHELAHTVHHNHSPKFWRMVEKFCPDFRAAKIWLKQYNGLPV